MLHQSVFQKLPKSTACVCIENVILLYPCMTIRKVVQWKSFRSKSQLEMEIFYASLENVKMFS